MKKGMVYSADGLKVVEYDMDSYKFIHDSVGGYIERIPVGVFDRVHIDMWCNDEGKLIGLNPTVALSYKGSVYDIVVGDVAFTRSSKDGRTLTLTDKNIKLIEKVFDEMYDVMVKDGNGIHLIKCLEVA